MNRKRLRTLALSGMLVATLALAWAHAPTSKLPPGTIADGVVVDTSRHELSLFRAGKLLRTYRVSLGRSGAKQREGDRRTPRGRYVIDHHKADSQFHRALHISYPNAADRAKAAAARVSPGGAIMIHGLRNGLGWIGRFHRFVDWTSGCIAVTNAEIEEIWNAVPDGTPIEIRP